MAAEERHDRGQAAGEPVAGGATADDRAGSGPSGHASGERAGGGAADPTCTVLVYSDDRTVRERVRLALGRRPAKDLPLLSWLECATPPAVVRALDAGGIDLAVLDGEAVPAGGLGLCRQLKDEVFDCPPVLVLTGRPQDDWLAAWSRADAAVPHPLDPATLAATAARLLRARVRA
jgi:DNA-binding response OmpR family regulator